MKTLWIEDEDALNVGRVIVTKTGTKDCVVCYSCDERDDYEVRLKADLAAMLVELQLEIEEYKRDLSNKDINKDHEDFDHNNLIEVISGNIQEKIDLLQKQTINNCDNCFNGTTRGGCAVKELMKNKDCKYYMPREDQCVER